VVRGIRRGALIAVLTVGCGGISGPDGDGDQADGGMGTENQTSCTIGLSSTRVNTLAQLEVTADSNGVTCELWVGDESAGNADCAGGTVDLAPADLGPGKHNVVLTVRDGPSGSAECSRELQVVYPGPCGSDWDFGSDNSINRRDVMQYDEVGRQTVVTVDTDANGTVDQVFTNHFDEVGRLESQDHDIPADGTIDTVVRWQYNANGTVESHEVDQGADGSVNGRAVYLYTGANVLRERHDDNNLDGNTDTIVKYTSDPGGIPFVFSAIEEDFNADGTAETRYTYVNDDVGQQLSFTYDNPVGGPIDAGVTNSFTCWQ
jgi:hypothetical protein